MNNNGIHPIHLHCIINENSGTEKKEEYNLMDIAHNVFLTSKKSEILKKRHLNHIKQNKSEYSDIENNYNHVIPVLEKNKKKSIKKRK